MKKMLLLFLGTFLISSCIKTDFVEEVVVAPQILITPNITSIKVDDKIQLSGVFTNNYGRTENKQILWSTTTPEIISISPNGLITALKAGEGVLKAVVSTVESIRNIKITTDVPTQIGSTNKSGSFKSAGSGSYTVTGDVSIITEGGKSKITVNDKFKASVGPSLFLLLTNHTNGSYSVMANNPVINGTSAQISLTRLTKFEGSMSWDIPQGIDANNYKYALLYCTLGPVFGFAELK